MRIIVVGAGKVGTALCRSLVDEKHDGQISRFWNKPRLTTAMSLSP